MQIVRRMVSVCTRSRNPVATVQKAMQKYVMALHVDYRDLHFEDRIRLLLHQGSGY